MPTTTDTIIPNDSCHPSEQKYAEIHIMINRMNNYLLNKSSKEQGYDTIKQITYYNKYDLAILNNISRNKHTAKQGNEEKTNWHHLRIYGKRPRSLQSCSRIPQSKSHIPLTTLSAEFSAKKQSTKKARNPLDKSGVYRLTCPDCNMK